MKALELLIIPAETRVDRGVGSTVNKTWERAVADLYQPVTLLMAFPLGELAELRRLING